MNTEKTAGLTWPRLSLVFILSVLVLSCTSGNIVALFQNPTPTPTSTLTPTPTPTPTPTTGSLAGEIIEAAVPSTNVTRPDLTDALIVLCLKTSTNQCVVDEKLSTRSDNLRKFILESIPPGEYIVLYNPYPIDDISAYWKQWDMRKLIFTDFNALCLSMASKGTFNIGSGTGGGVSAKIVNGKMQMGSVHKNTAVWLKSSPLVVEFVGEQIPLSVKIVAGQTTKVTIQSHTSIKK